MRAIYKILLITAGVGLASVGVAVATRRYGRNKDLLELPTEASSILREARKYDGIEEKKENQGWEDASFERKMLASGWARGTAYCANFVSMVLQQVCRGDAQKFFKQKLSAWVPTAWANLSKKTAYSEPITHPEPGCLVFYYGHVEICDTVNSDGTMYVVTANSTSGDGKKEGVFRKLRYIGAPIGDDPFKGFVRITKTE